MDKKYFFFDIDGTLTSCKEHGMVPEDTREAIRKAKQAGHFIALATGRSYTMAKQFALDLGIDHLVCNGGNDLYIHHECLRHRSLDHSLCLEVIAECKEKQLPFCIASEDSYIRYTHNESFLDVVPEQRFLGKLEVVKDIDYEAIPHYERIMIGIQEGEEQKLDVFQRHHLPMRYNPYYCILEPDHKDDGIKDMMQLMQQPMDNVVVFGDSRNDIRMFRIAPTSIAMGNAIDEVKALASYVTASSDDGGIIKALMHFGWIA